MDYDGFLDQTFEDEDYEPYGREIVVRVYYDWTDYDPADEPRPLWGAEIVDAELLAVRCFDVHGQTLDTAPPSSPELAWEWVERYRDELTERCTQAGRVAWEQPLQPTQAAALDGQQSDSPSVAGMAPSVRERSSRRRRHKLG